MYDALRVLPCLNLSACLVVCLDHCLVRQAQQGAIKQRVTESQLKQFLAQFSDSARKPSGKISVRHIPLSHIDWFVCLTYIS